MTFLRRLRGVACLTRLRRIMVLMLILCIIMLLYLKIVNFAQSSARYNMLAKLCAKKQIIYMDYTCRYLNELHAFESGLRPRATLDFISVSPAGSERAFAVEGAARNRKLAERWGRLKSVYERAARFPWVTIPAELQHPSWEDELERHADGEW
jgi:hypothetical protein